MRTLGDLLGDPDIAAVPGTDWIIYLRVLLTDARGSNLRNVIRHGLASAAAVDFRMADRLTHALLLVSLLRQGSTGRPSDI